MNPDLHCVLLAVLGLAATSVAQEPEAGLVPAAGPRVEHALAPAAPLVPIHTQAPDSGLQYGLWAAGADYKASFHDGATFVPYLGRDYPTLRSLRWRTLSARVGASELCDASAPQPVCSGFHAEYDLGGIVEAYDVRREGLEQTFVLDSKPAGTGDLVIRGAVQTSLRTTPQTGRHGELVFADDQGRPIVSYGAATAIDALGHRCAMQTAVADGVVTLTLDGAWLAEAACPIVVDPLLGVIIAVGGAPLENMDLARDTLLNTGNIWHTTQRFVAAGDSDIWLRRFDDDGTGDTLVFTDITASWSSMEPSIGLHQAAASTVLAFTRDLPVTGRRIRFHEHARNDFNMQNNYGVIETGTYNAWRPDVAYDQHPLGAQFLLVVFQREGTGPWAEVNTSAVYGSAIDLNGTGAATAGAPFAIVEQAIEDYERPNVGRVQLGGPQEWTVAYQVIGNVAPSTHSDWDIELRRVDRNGNVTAPYSLGVGDGEHQMTPRLAGYNAAHLLAYVRSTAATVGPRPTGDNGQVLRTNRFDWNGANFVVPTLGYILNSNQDPRLVLTGVDIDRTTMSHYALTFRSTATQNVYLSVVGYHGWFLDSETVFAAGAADNTVSGAVAYDDDNERFLLGYCVNNAAGNGTYVDRYVHPAQPAPTTAGLACGTGQLQWLGSQLIGSQGVGVRLGSVPAGALSTVLVGTQPFSSLLVGVPPVHSGCWLLVPNTGPDSLGFLPLSVGPTSTWLFNLPESLAAMTMHFQGVEFDAGNLVVFTTQRLSVPLVK